MKDLSLEELLNAAGRRMSNDLKERLLQHPGELGTDREEIVRLFLRAYLPKRFEVSTGFVFDSKGSISQQMDIIIADSLVCPRFETVGGKRIYPCESVVSVGQVRSSISSLASLESAISNVMSVKLLDRSAGGHAIGETNEDAMDHHSNHLHQIFGFVFITGKALSSERVRDELFRIIPKHEPCLWPNIIFALDHYLITFCCDNGVCPNPMDARGIAVQTPSESQDILLHFYYLLGGAIEATKVSSLPYWEYLSRVNNWDANVYYSTQSDPPPLLSSIPG